VGDFLTEINFAISQAWMRPEDWHNFT